jgi:D-amino-acid oxidase
VIWERAVDILVIGCGVSGLTSGLRLLQAGHRVTIWARALPPDTTSNVAAAIWFPYKAHPTDKVTIWGAETYQTFKQLQATEGEAAGIILASVVDLHVQPMSEPAWAGAVEDFRPATPEELPPGYSDGIAFTAPVIDTSIYLDYLVRTFQAQGGQIVQRALVDLGEALAHSPVVINCSGLGARELVGDRDLRPSRGQVVRIRHNGFRHALLDDYGPEAPTYVVPRLHDIVLGGTDDEGNESTEPDPAVTQSILRRVARLSPRFAAVASDDILNVVCGLRPVRSTVRVEAERSAPDRLVVHNYGHGGAGITLSWGCAAEVVRLVAAGNAP